MLKSTVEHHRVVFHVRPMTFENVGSVENTEVDSRFKLNKFGRVVFAAETFAGGVYDTGGTVHVY